MGGLSNLKLIIVFDYMHLRKNDIRDIEVRDLPSSQQSGGFIMEYGYC